MNKSDIHFDLTLNYDCFDIKLLIGCNKLCDNKQFIQYETYQNSMKFLFNKLKIFSTPFVQFGRGIGPIEMEFKKI